MGYFNRFNKLTNEDFMAIGAGLYPGIRSVTMQGILTDTPIVRADLISWATTYVFPSDAGETLQVVSTLADTQLVTVVGLNELFESVVATVQLNGTTPVNLPGLWTRVNVLTNSDETEFTGIIDVTNGVNIFCRMLAIDQTSVMGVYSVPAGYRSQVLAITAELIKSIGNSDDFIQADLYFRSPGNVFKRTISVGLQRRGSTASQIINLAPRGIVGPIDLLVKIQASSADFSSIVRVDFIEQKV